MTGLLRSWAFLCDCSINSSITFHAKAEGKMERWIKNYPFGRNSWVAEDIVMDWGYSSILFLKFNHPALCRVRHNRVYDSVFNKCWHSNQISKTILKQKYN